MANLANMVPLKPCIVTTGFSYDFATDGGATGVLNTPVFIPAGAKIKAVWFDVTTPLTSGGAATIQIGGVVTGVVLTPALPYTDGVFAASAPNAFGTVDNIVAPNPGVGTVLGNISSFKNASASQIKMTIAGAALTAGAFNCYIEYTT